MSDDITFCDNTKCKVKKCFRNPKNIKHFEIPHSFASLEGTDLCPSFKKRRITNFEKIKQMSVEELAEYILDEFRIDCEQCECRFDYNSCKYCIKHHLESEAEE